MSERQFSDLIDLNEFLLNLGHCQGGQRLIDTIKSMRVSIYRRLADQNPIFPKDMIGRDKDGLPKCLKTLRDDIRARDTIAIRSVLTVFQLSYVVKGNKVPTVDTIVAPSEAKESALADFKAFIDTDANKVLKKTKYPTWKVPHMTSKSGPNGHALNTCWTELPQLPEDLVKDLQTVGGQMFTN